MAELLGFEKVSHILRGGMAHQVLRRIGLLELAVVHYGNAIRQRDSVGQIMRHIQCRQAMFAVKAQNLTAHF